MQNPDILFRLKNLSCEYQPSQTVLYVDDLEIKRNQLTFLIGSSGIGKSTLIETLGLMNNTFGKNDNSSATYYFDGHSVNLNDLWNNKDEYIAPFRAKHFSFLFQNHSLMTNLSCGENMCLGQLVDEKTSSDQAKKKVLHAMSQVFPNEAPNEIFNKKITEISGGQRQRLTFIRAITAPFNVIFCDEPTGNLDRKTADILILQLKTALKEKKSSGIIVSHNLELAFRHADQIIGITPVFKNEKISHGEISPANILQRNHQGVMVDQNGNPVSFEWFDQKIFQ